MPRFAKQLLYGLLFLAIFLGIPAGMYFALLKPTPTCWDGIQNGQEQGIDCGGSCPYACIPKNLRPLEAGDVKIFPIDGAHASFFVEATNPNVDYAAASVNYALTMEAKSGASRTLPGLAYFYGGEVRMLAFPNVAVPEDIMRASISFEPPEWIPAAAWPRPPLRVLHMETRRDDAEQQIIVEGELVSDDTIALPSVEVVALFRGAFGGIEGVSRTELAEVVPAVARSFRVFHPDIRGVDVGATSAVLSARRP